MSRVKTRTETNSLLIIKFQNITMVHIKSNLASDAFIQALTRSIIQLALKIDIFIN